MGGNLAKIKLRYKDDREILHRHNNKIEGISNYKITLNTSENLIIKLLKTIIWNLLIF